MRLIMAVARRCWIPFEDVKPKDSAELLECPVLHALAMPVLLQRAVVVLKEDSVVGRVLINMKHLGRLLYPHRLLASSTWACRRRTDRPAGEPVPPFLRLELDRYCSSSGSLKQDSDPRLPLERLAPGALLQWLAPLPLHPMLFQSGELIGRSSRLSSAPVPFEYRRAERPDRRLRGLSGAPLEAEEEAAAALPCLCPCPEAEAEEVVAVEASRHVP